MRPRNDAPVTSPASVDGSSAEGPSAYTSVMTRRVAWLLRAVILVSGIYQTFFGETAIGILTLICLAGITAPSIFTRGLVSFFPIEIEIVLFVMVLIQYVLGEARDLYTTIPYYDKFVHAMLPGMVGFIGFLIAYSMVASGKLIARTSMIIGLIVLMSLGVAAVEEIAEYSSDMLLYPRIPGWHHFKATSKRIPITTR